MEDLLAEAQRLVNEILTLRNSNWARGPMPEVIYNQISRLVDVFKQANSVERDVILSAITRDHSGMLLTFAKIAAEGSGPTRSAPVDRTLPELRLYVAFGLDEDIDERPVVEVSLIKLGRYPTLVESAAFLDFFRKRFEEVVVLDALEDLLFVVEREIAGNGARQPPCGFFRFDQRHSFSPRSFTSIALCTAVLHVPVTSTRYVPASLELIFVIVREFVVAPGIIVPFFFQTYVSVPLPEAVVVNETVCPALAKTFCNGDAVASALTVSMALLVTGEPQAAFITTE